jgi:glyoxylase-like metal-dependent hydrolase (beta-lactamase superfamily II)
VGGRHGYADLGVREELTIARHGAIAPAGGWSLQLIEVGSGRHPGSWVGPTYPTWYWSPINVLLLESEAELVLVDCGAGPTSAWWPFEGFRSDTQAALTDAGVSAREIGLVVLTHLDYDHAGGLLEGTWPHDLGLAFPHAQVIVHRDAVDAARLADPDDEYNVGTRLLELLDREERLVVLDDGDEVATNVRIRHAPGHRVGHVCVHVDDSDPFVHAADTFHHEVHAAYPEWDDSSDQFTELALETRRRVLAELAASGARTVITHMQGPYPFRVVAHGDGFTTVTTRP